MNAIVRTLKLGSAFAAIALFTAISAGTATAQTPTIGASFAVGVPVGEFKDTLDRIAYGVDFDLGYHFGTVPLEVGFTGSVKSYGSTERTEPWSNTIPDVTLTVETSNNIATGHMYVRLIEGEGFIRPYADGKFGFTYLFTETSVHSRGFSENGEVASSTNFDDIVFSYGGAIGTQIRLWKSDAPSETSEVREVTLDARVGYTAGGEAEYLTAGSIVRRENGKVEYAPKTSRTDMIDARLGVQVRF
ncbi:MAG: hypothetical protein H7X80_02710 [bacterium]|nr:hypothetical protein [Candidatus Kapabacteria bacterium]